MDGLWWGMLVSQRFPVNRILGRNGTYRLGFHSNPVNMEACGGIIPVLNQNTETVKEGLVHCL